MKQLELPLNQLFIHGDELCPCGSGKMFSDCCKNKPDLGTIKSPKPTEVLLMERIRKSLKKRRVCLHPDQIRCRGHIKEAHALQNHKINTEDDIVVIVGANNSGKTYIVELFNYVFNAKGGLRCDGFPVYYWGIAQKLPYTFFC